MISGENRGVNIHPVVVCSAIAVFWILAAVGLLLMPHMETINDTLVDSKITAVYYSQFRSSITESQKIAYIQNDNESKMQISTDRLSTVDVATRAIARSPHDNTNTINETYYGDDFYFIEEIDLIENDIPLAYYTEAEAEAGAKAEAGAEAETEAGAGADQPDEEAEPAQDAEPMQDAEPQPLITTLNELIEEIQSGATEITLGDEIRVDRDVDLGAITSTTVTIYPAGPNKRHFNVAANYTVSFGGRIILDGKDTGGGIYVMPGDLTVTINNAVIQNCYSNNIGGGISSYSSGLLTINGGIISNNKAEYDGGGIAAFGPVIIQNNVTITGNEAFGSGGGILTAGAKDEAIIRNNVKILNNKAGTLGGGIFADGGLTIYGDVIILGNIAQAGGGIFATSTTEPVNIKSDVEILYNTAEILGGGIYADSEHIEISDDTAIQNNEASLSDDDIFIPELSDALKPEDEEEITP